MFYGCTNLKTAPALPATTLSNDCYDAMFFGCSNLEKAPALPATVLTSNCYLYMFYGCSSLKTIPDLPATTLADKCYFAMFALCTSLEISETSDATHSKEWSLPAGINDANFASDTANMFGECGENVCFSRTTNPATLTIGTTYYQLNTLTKYSVPSGGINLVINMPSNTSVSATASENISAVTVNGGLTVEGVSYYTKNGNVLTQVTSIANAGTYYVLVGMKKDDTYFAQDFDENDVNVSGDGAKVEVDSGHDIDYTDASYHKASSHPNESNENNRLIVYFSFDVTSNSKTPEVSNNNHNYIVPNTSVR